MPKVLTTASTVVCGHGATAGLTSSAKLTVGGNPVLLASDYANWPFDTLCAQKDSSKGQKPCTLITGITAGRSSKLTVGGVAVLLDMLGGTTDGAPQNTNLAGTAIQAKLEAP